MYQNQESVNLSDSMINSSLESNMLSEANGALMRVLPLAVWS